VHVDADGFALFASAQSAQQGGVAHAALGAGIDDHGRTHAVHHCIGDDHLSQLAPRVDDNLISAVAAQRLRIGDQHAFGAEIDQNAQILQAVEPENAVGADMLAPQQRGEQAGDRAVGKAQLVDLDQINHGRAAHRYQHCLAAPGQAEFVDDAMRDHGCLRAGVDQEAIGPLTIDHHRNRQPLVAIAVDRLIGGRGAGLFGQCQGIRLKLHNRCGKRDGNGRYMGKHRPILRLGKPEYHDGTPRQNATNHRLPRRGALIYRAVYLRSDAL